MFELPPPVLELRDACLNLGNRRVLKHCDLCLYPGEVLAIVGPSGAGKSSLLNVLSGRQAPSTCALFQLQGQDVRASEHHTVLQLRRRATGYVAQDAHQALDLHLSAAANIARRLFDLGLNHAGDALTQARSWIERLGLAPGRAHEPVIQFSGGMRQRIQIAAAMVHGPSVLFLDEPTSGLDSVAQAALIDILMQLKHERATSMLFVTHDLRLARLIADRALVMDQGRIVSEAVIDRLLTEPDHPTAQALVKAVL
ncbi:MULTISPECIES: ATP-binding cassette domain-containing protein [Gammaproteobacteria]|uniref:Phosphonates transport ATP-binding protein PhnK n=4 Tax=Gammaproteobacteria TaxID=1236 RepID=A0A1B2LQN8_AERSA|nr:MULTISPECIES: ATP-binding cassette domain-containing protein [Gammaproteobacteria]KRW71260.1 hypothetical protein AO741_00545 [Pseudomonas sp. TTU2014-105ASC]MBP6724164.1 ATP-binding cassette domain-containing protein [Halioglobus sp.]MBP8262260.1 ATP-binding cassette domain-containing protein [Pseudomonas sp.]MCQ4234020.1 ATP-binding cassette domain-containing protein [Stutzerimonas degradans]PKM04270.1 MAG: hypothetical protein CVV16_05700 [Gammaproteobacteria bacterium HGW-Gammaproteobac